MKIFLRRPGQMREQWALRLITGLNPQVNPIRADAATILFCIFATRGRLNKPCLVTRRLPAKLLPPLYEIDFPKVARVCADIGIKPSPLSFFCIEAKLKLAFVFGFAAWTPVQIRESLLRLASALR